MKKIIAFAAITALLLCSCNNGGNTPVLSSENIPTDTAQVLPEQNTETITEQISESGNGR